MDRTSELVRTIQRHAKSMRCSALKMTFSSGSGHVGPAFSATDICATLYFGVMKHDANDPAMPDRDRFILSKGHGVFALYTALHECGYFGEEMLYTFEKPNTHFAGHPCAKGVPGIEFSTGSMGHGISVAAGMALASRISKTPYNVYVVAGDGELNEGSNWEAVMFAKQNKLDNLCVIVDANGFQHDSLCRDVMDMDITAIFRAHGWDAVDVDGHDVAALLEAFSNIDHHAGRPTVIVAHTIKGKGVSFIENNNNWHHAGISQEQLACALGELEREGK